MISFLAAILIDFFFALVKSSCVALLILLNENAGKRLFAYIFLLLRLGSSQEQVILRQDLLRNKKSSKRAGKKKRNKCSTNEIKCVRMPGAACCEGVATGTTCDCMSQSQWQSPLCPPSPLTSWHPNGENVVQGFVVENFL